MQSWHSTEHSHSSNNIESISPRRDNVNLLERQLRFAYFLPCKLYSEYNATRNFLKAKAFRLFTEVTHAFHTLSRTRTHAKVHRCGRWYQSRNRCVREKHKQNIFGIGFWLKCTGLIQASVLTIKWRWFIALNSIVHWIFCNFLDSFNVYLHAAIQLSMHTPSTSFERRNSQSKYRSVVGIANWRRLRNARWIAMK